jgi:hypothetical protein
MLVYFILSNSLVRRASSVQGAGAIFFTDAVPHGVNLNLDVKYLSVLA